MTSPGEEEQALRSCWRLLTGLAYRKRVPLPSFRVRYGPDPAVGPDREQWERKGHVPNVIFSCANPVVADTVFVHYGGGDHVVGLATCTLDDLLEFALLEK